MVGRDMSANLGGMLTQIGQSVGERAKAADPVIAAATKPKGDMNDPQHLQRLAQWASQNGDPQAASMYMNQARAATNDMQRKQKEAKDLQRTQSANAVTAQYKQALESGDQALVEKAREAVIAGANANGYDAQDRMNAASKAVRAEADAAFAEAEKKRIGEERAATEQFAQKINGTTDIDEVMEAVKTAPPELAEQAQRMANTRVAFLKNVEARQKAKEQDAAAVSTEFTMPANLPEKLNTQFKGEHTRIEKMAEAGKNKDGTWKEGARDAVEKAMTKLIDDANRAAVSLIAAEESDKRQRLRSVAHRRQMISVEDPTKDEIQRIQKELYDELNKDTGFFEANKQPTYDEIIEAYRNKKHAALDREVNIINGREPDAKAEGGEAGSSKDNPATPATRADAEKLPSGTWYKDPAGNVRQKA